MAGDWIKIRTNLPDDPRLRAISRACSVSENEALGGLLRLWAIADKSTTDGFFLGADAAWIDGKVGIAGFAESLIKLNWLRASSDGVQLVNFDEHNGQSAKRRAQEQARKAASRALETNRPPPKRTNVRKASAPKADRKRSQRREEKEREKKPAAAAKQRSEQARAREGSPDGRDSAAAAAALRSALEGEGIAEPVLTELASLAGLTPQIVQSAAVKCRAEGKGVGVLVLNLRAASAKVQRAPPGKPGPGIFDPDPRTDPRTDPVPESQPQEAA